LQSDDRFQADFRTDRARGRLDAVPVHTVIEQILGLCHWA